MSTDALSWLAFSLIFVMFVVVVATETLWLARNNWCATRRALAFSLATNGVGMAISAAILFAAVMVSFMLIMGPAGEGSDTPDRVYIGIFVAAVILVLAVLTALKLLLLKMLGIRSGREALVFSTVLSLALMLSVLVLPAAAVYFLS